MAGSSTALLRRYQGLRALSRWGAIALGAFAALGLQSHRVLGALLVSASIVAYNVLPRLAWRRIYLGAHARFMAAFEREETPSRPGASTPS